MVWWNGDIILYAYIRILKLKSYRDCSIQFAIEASRCEQRVLFAKNDFHPLGTLPREVLGL